MMPGLFVLAAIGKENILFSFRIATKVMNFG